MVNAGMFVAFGIGGGSVTLLDGVTLTWAQNSKQYFPCGSLTAAAIFRGPVSWEGSFKRAYVNTGMMGSAYIGTNQFIGTLYPLGITGGTPTIAGTILISGGSLTNMDREQLDIVEEEHKFLIYNMTFTN